MVNCQLVICPGKLPDKQTRAQKLITTYQRTISSQDNHLSRQTFGLPFTLSSTQMSKWASRKIYRITTLNSHHYKSFQEDKHLSHFMFLPVRLVPSSYYIVLFLIHVFWLVRREMWLSKNFFGWLTQPWNDQKLSHSPTDRYSEN